MSTTNHMLPHQPASPRRTMTALLVGGALVVTAAPASAQMGPPTGATSAPAAPAAAPASSSGGFSQGGSSAAAAPSSGGGGSSPDNLYGLKPSDAPRLITLDEALGRAAEGNFDLRIAEEKIIQQQANVRRAWSGLLPNVSVSGGYTYNYPEQKVAFGSEAANQQQALLYGSIAGIIEQTAALNSDPVARAQSLEQAEALRAASAQFANAKVNDIVVQPAHVGNANLTVTMPLFNGRALPLLQNAYEAVDLARKSSSQAKTALLHAVARAYYAAATTKKMVGIAERQVENSTAHRDATATRVELGVVTPLSLQRAELDVIRAQQSLRAAKNGYNIALGMLGSLIDQDTAFDVEIPAEVRAVEMESDQEALVARAIASRPDVQIQKSALAIADRSRTDAWMQFLPTLALTAQGRYTTNTQGFAAEPFTGAVMLNANLPIYDGGQRYAALSESASKVREELLKVRQLERKIESQIRGNLADIAVKREALVQAREALDLSQKTHENAKNMYELGVATSLDVIDANLAVFASELSLVQAELDLEQARIGLMYVLGEFPAGIDVTPRRLSDEERDDAREFAK